MDAMKMVETRLAPVRLRFGTKGTFDALTHEQQDGRRVADGFIEHHELNVAVSFIQPDMVWPVRMDELKRVGLEDGWTNVLGGFWRGSRTFASITVAEAHTTKQHQYD